MEIKTVALLLLALFVVSSLEAVWADEEQVFNIEDIEDSEDVYTNGFNDNVEDEVDILSEGSSCKDKKVKSSNYESGRCISSECKETCKKDGFKAGQCTTVEESDDKVKKCYCTESCHKKGKKDKKEKKDKKHKKGKKHDHIAPANPPSSGTPDSPPMDDPSPIVPSFPPTSTPDLPITIPENPTKTPNSYTSLEDDDSDIEFH